MLQNEVGTKFGLVVNDMASVNVDSKLIKKQTQGFEGVVPPVTPATHTSMASYTMLLISTSLHTGYNGTV
jgi:hypothetical protein